VRRGLIGVAILGLAACAAVAGASEAAARKATKQQLAVIAHRQAQMKDLGRSMKTLSAFAQGELKDVQQARAAAATLARVGGVMPMLWPAGTGVGVGESNTRASAWKERDQFAARIAQFRTAAAAMNAAAATGDRAKVAQRLGAVGAECKACHTPYQVKD
jgi:cytochrome c556